MSALRDIKEAAFRPYQDPVCTEDDFVEAVFQRPAVNSVETHGREVPCRGWGRGTVFFRGAKYDVE